MQSSLDDRKAEHLLTGRRTAQPNVRVDQRDQSTETVAGKTALPCVGSEAKTNESERPEGLEERVGTFKYTGNTDNNRVGRRDCAEAALSVFLRTAVGRRRRKSAAKWTLDARSRVLVHVRRHRLQQKSLWHCSYGGKNDQKATDGSARRLPR